jgi:hypothetical protein
MHEEFDMGDQCFSAEKEVEFLNSILAEDGYPQCEKCESFAIDVGKSPESKYGHDPIYSMRCMKCGHEWQDA